VVFVDGTETRQRLRVMFTAVGKDKTSSERPSVFSARRLFTYLLNKMCDTDSAGIWTWYLLIMWRSYWRLTSSATEAYFYQECQRSGNWVRNKWPLVNRLPI